MVLNITGLQDLLDPDVHTPFRAHGSLATQFLDRAQESMVGFR